MALEPRRYDRILNEAPDDVLGAIFGFLLYGRVTVQGVDDVLVARGLKPMAQRGPGLPGFRGGGLEILGPFATGAAPPPPWDGEDSSPETLVDDVPETVGWDSNY